jgi:hypothetical protein
LAEDIEAETHAEAAEKAENSLDLNAMLNREGVEYADEISYFLVDPRFSDGEIDYDNTIWLDADYTPLKD